MCIKITSQNIGTNWQEEFSLQKVSEKFSFVVISGLKGSLSSNPNFYFTAFNVSLVFFIFLQIGDYVELDYKREYPMDMAISD